MTTATTIRELHHFEGQNVVLKGWLHGKRSGGKIVFLLVRDGTGVCQCVVEAQNCEAFETASALTMESSLSVTGRITAEGRATGGYEMAVSAIGILQTAEEYPITRKAHGVDFLMSHRHLWLRSARQTTILRIRHTLIKACRDFFDGHGFTLVDAPVLTPGAGEDTQSLVPVEYFGNRMFLTQTGQLYLESACMALRKVYCFGPTFRAEKSKTRRHLAEFWMVEPEVAFADLDEIIELTEDTVCAMIQAVLDKHEADLASLGRDIELLRKVKKPFPRITYTQAVDTLRSPDTKKQLEDEIVRDRGKLLGWTDHMTELEAQLKTIGKPWKRERLQKEISVLCENIQEMEADLATRPQHLQLAQSFQWGGDLGGSDETILSRNYERPVFVTDYPREAKAFYMKINADDGRTVRNMDLLAPEGYGEIVGGSQREEDPEVLLTRMKEAGLDPKQYTWYLDLRKYGSVPHGGFGLGIERVLAWVCGLKHVREAIPFPRLMGRVDL